jgi:hypothetical protein
MAAAVLPEVTVGRRAFPMAQQLFMGQPTSTPAQMVVGWYDSSVHPESGSFALVQTGAGLDDLIGEIIGVTFNRRTVYAYVLQAATLPDAQMLALARRAYAGLYRLSLEQITAAVAPVA